MQEPAANSYHIAQGVVLVYMLLMVSIGLYFARYMKGADDYFKGGNRIPGWIAGVSAYMTTFSAYAFVGVASVVFHNGPAGILMETGPALAFCGAALFFAPRWHRARVTTPTEYLEERYGLVTRQLIAWLSVMTSLIWSGIRIYALSRLMHTMLGIPIIPGILCAGAIMLTYVLLGGIWAVVVTDAVQMVVLLTAVIPLFFISLAHIGGVSGFMEAVPEGYLSFPSQEVQPNGNYDWFWLMAWWFSYFFDYNGNYGVIQRFCITPSEKEARKGAIWAAALSFPHALILFFPVMVAKITLPEAHPEGAYGLISTTLLPAGMIGVVSAAMLAATMSAMDSTWNVLSAIITKDIYQRLFRPNATERELLKAGRWSTVFIASVAIGSAITIALTETELFGLAAEIASIVVAPATLPILLGLLLYRMPRWTGLAAIAMGVLAFVINQAILPNFFPETEGVFHYALQIGISFGLVISTMLLANLFGARKEKQDEGLQAFHERLNTPAPPVDTATDHMPNPLRIIGIAVMLVGVLFLAMIFLPQTLQDRILTGLAGLFLLFIGRIMNWYGGRNNPESGIASED